MQEFKNVESYTDYAYGSTSLDHEGDNFVETKATQLINMGKIHIGIREFQGQSISNTKTFQHLEYETYIKKYPFPHLHCKPLEEFECIYFHTPIRNLETLTLEFTNPDKPLRLPKDIVDVTPKIRSLGDGANDTSSTHRLYLDYEDDLTKDLLLTPNDRVYFKEFDSSETKTLFNGENITTYVPFLDNFMNNTEEGVYVDVSNNYLYTNPYIDFQTASPFSNNVIVPNWLDLGNAQLYYTLSGSREFNKDNKKVKMFIPRNRIRIPMKIQGINYKEYSSV